MDRFNAHLSGEMRGYIAKNGLQGCTAGQICDHIEGLHPGAIHIADPIAAALQEWAYANSEKRVATWWRVHKNG